MMQSPSESAVKDMVWFVHQVLCLSRLGEFNPVHTVLKKERDTDNCSLGACAENKLSIQLRAVNTEVGDGVNDWEQQNRE